MKREIMKRAHEIARTLEGDYMARMSLALRQAWEEVKKMKKKWVVDESGKLDMTYERYMALSDAEKAEIKANFSYEEFPGRIGKAWYIKHEGLANVEVVPSENLRRKVATKPERAKDIFASDELAAKAGIHPNLLSVLKEKFGFGL